MKTRKFSPQESGSKVICSGHAHAIAAMHHNIVRATPSANWIDHESIESRKLASPFDLEMKHSGAETIIFVSAEYPFHTLECD